ncbi:MAG TPA: ATP-binding cassette domain-containing protein [Solirubrobacteraceae bacterium]|nr:ATP-binding cassette domain-containing protein [Solirubrobacteraceae bacterium]
MKTSVPAIEAEALVKTYGDVRALDGLSLAVPAGTIFALLGPNGAGKSTTVRILTTLSKPDAGSARVAGADVLADPAAVRRAIGCVGQRSGVDVDATGAENLILQGQVHGLHGRSLAARVAELLDQFGLAEAGGRFVRTYSGGMQRRLDIAMALVHRPQILFLDEPTTGLDPEVRAEMWRVISEMARDGLSILLTTHYLEEADRLASELAIVDRGRVVAAGSPERLKAELRGDSIQVELAFAANGAVHAALEPLPGIRELVVEGTSLHARADSGARAVPAVLGALEAGGLDVASVTVSRPSLDDVYLRHAGRSFE